VRLEDDSFFRPHTLLDGVSIGTVSVESQSLQPGELMSLNAFSFTLPFSIQLTSQHAVANILSSSTGAVSAVIDSTPNG
jgi:hypothetical protein